ncbi:hypothetical protein EYF80_029498 [Liparis tanakae]|uniref:Uncharacterized protein n=1 Tax=Liparis tanakae TaxID=230148 RepID=A0A4Z2H5I1_9TELE|nr:hypothetical protein EYF80_029498 [Liparis tanakae]
MSFGLYEPARASMSCSKRLYLLILWMGLSRTLLAFSCGVAKPNPPSYRLMGRLECLQHTALFAPAAPRSLVQDSSEQKLPWREIWNF